METDKEKHIKIVSTRIRRNVINGNTLNSIFWDDLDMLLDLILGGEA